jgi:hypothetical protein
MKPRQFYSRSPNLDDRIWPRILKKGQDECWPWLGVKDRDGYGKLRFQTKWIRATRALWEVLHGPFTDDLIICHKCDNPPCCNPNHLFLGTTQINALDAFKKGRRVVGSKNPNAKLKEEDVMAILALIGILSERKIAAKFGISKGTIYWIKQQRSWKHITTNNQACPASEASTSPPVLS